MADQREISSSASADNEDEIEKDAEKAYRNISREARVFENLVTGVDDEEFEHVWKDETCHSSDITCKKQKSVKDDVQSASRDCPRDSATDYSGILSPSCLDGFQTVSLSALPGSRLKIDRYVYRKHWQVRLSNSTVGVTKKVYESSTYNLRATVEWWTTILSTKFTYHRK